MQSAMWEYAVTEREESIIVRIAKKTDILKITSDIFPDFIQKLSLWRLFQYKFAIFLQILFPVNSSNELTTAEAVALKVSAQTYPINRFESIMYFVLLNSSNLE